MMNTNQQTIDTLRNWTSITKTYTKSSYNKSIIQVLNTFIPFFLVWIIVVLLSQFNLLLGIMGSLFLVPFLARIVIIQHDCSHNSFFPKRNHNILLGHFCSLFTLLPFTYWKNLHNLHHAHNGKLEEEVRDIGSVMTMNVEEYSKASKRKRISYQIYRHPISLLLFGPLYYFFVANRLPLRNVGTSYLYHTIHTAILVALYYLLGNFIGWNIFIPLFLISFTIFGSLTIRVFYVQHQHEHTYREWKNEWQSLLAALQGSSFYNLPYRMHRCTGYIGYHHIHHLSVQIPNYNLKRCHDEHPELSIVTEIIQPMESFSMIWNFLWDEKQKRMITLKEYNKLK